MGHVWAVSGGRVAVLRTLGSPTFVRPYVVGVETGNRQPIARQIL